MTVDPRIKNLTPRELRENAAQLEEMTNQMFSDYPDRWSICSDGNQQEELDLQFAIVGDLRKDIVDMRARAQELDFNHLSKPQKSKPD